MKTAQGKSVIREATKPSTVYTSFLLHETHLEPNFGPGVVAGKDFALNSLHLCGC